MTISRSIELTLQGPNLAKPPNAANAALSRHPHCTGVPIDSSLCSFTHTARPDYNAFGLDLALPCAQGFEGRCLCVLACHPERRLVCSGQHDAAKLHQLLIRPILSTLLGWIFFGL